MACRRSSRVDEESPVVARAKRIGNVDGAEARGVRLAVCAVLRLLTARRVSRKTKGVCRLVGANMGRLLLATGTCSQMTCQCRRMRRRRLARRVRRSGGCPRTCLAAVRANPTPAVFFFSRGCIFTYLSHLSRIFNSNKHYICLICFICLICLNGRIVRPFLLGIVEADISDLSD